MASDEDRIVALLDAYHKSTEIGEQERIEREVIEIVDRYFRRELKPVIAKVFGVLIGDGSNDTSLRYTAMVNDFFVKVLDTKPDEFWRARAAKQLREWSTVVIANQIRDYLRRRGTLQKIQSELAPLVEQRSQHFERTFGTGWSFEVFDKLEHLRSEKDETGEIGWVLTYRYIGGMPYPDIAEQLGLSIATTHRRRECGIALLREHFSR